MFYSGLDATCGAALDECGSARDDKENSNSIVGDRHSTAQKLLKSWVAIQDETARIEISRVGSSQWPIDITAWPEQRSSQRRSMPETRNQHHVRDLKQKDNLTKLNKLCIERGPDDKDAILASRVIRRLSQAAPRATNDQATRHSNRRTSGIPDFDDAVYSMEARRREREEKRRRNLNRSLTDQPLSVKERAEPAGSSIESFAEDNGRLLELARAQVKKELDELRRSCAASEREWMSLSSKNAVHSEAEKPKKKPKGVRAAREEDTSTCRGSSSANVLSPAKRMTTDRNPRSREIWRRRVRSLVSMLSRYEQRCRRPLLRKGFKELLRATVDWKLLYGKVQASHSRLSKQRHLRAWASLTRCILRCREETATENARVEEILACRACRVAKYVVKKWRRASANKGTEVTHLHSRVAAALARLPIAVPATREASGTVRPPKKRKSQRDLNNKESDVLRPLGNVAKTMQTNTVPLPTPPEVLRMYERAERLKCSKITRELRRTEQERMTRTDKEALRSNTEWRKRDHLKELKLRRRVIEQNRLLVMETLQRAERIWNRRVLGKCFAYFTDTLEERRFRELKAERWYLTVVRLKSIKAFTLWLESCRKLRLKAAELYQEKLARRALIWMRIGSAQSREGRIKCYTAKIQQGRCIRLLRVWSSVAAESLKEKYTKSDDIANRTVKRKVFSAWIMLPSIEGFEREVDTRKAELWNKVHRMMGYQAHQPANYDLVS